MAKILKKTREAEDDVMKWTASEYKYLKDFEDDLNKLKKHLNDFKTEKKTLGKAKKALRMVGRAERRVDKYTNNLEKDVRELAKQLPDNLRQEELDIEKQIEIAAKSILKKGSRYIGSLKNQVNSLITQFDLMKKYKNKSKEIEQKITIMISNMISNLIKEVETILRWIGGLVAAVKKQESFIKKLAA